MRNRRECVASHDKPKGLCIVPTVDPTSPPSIPAPNRLFARRWSVVAKAEASRCGELTGFRREDACVRFPTTAGLGRIRSIRLRSG